MISITHVSPVHKFCHLLNFSILEQIYPRDVVKELLSQDQAGEQRERKLNHVVMVYLLIAWSLMAGRSLRSVCDRFLRPLRLCSDEANETTPTSAALCYRRRVLGVRVFRHLFRRLCRPIASPQTPGAFAYGLRLMGIDGTKIAVATSLKNHACFRPKNAPESATASPFPHLLAVLLVEIGTHAIVDAIPALASVGESRVARGLLRSITQGMLVLLDCGFANLSLLQDLVQRQAHVLARLASNRLLGAGQPLGDGSVLLSLTPKQYPLLREPLTVRIISYVIHPQAADLLSQVTPSHSQHGAGTHNPRVREVHRLVTTLLDPSLYPALDLCLLYHERWEVELVIDEVKDHQRLAQNPLSSQNLFGVFQEFYALLLAHYVMRVLMGQAASALNQDPDRISFTQALQLVTDALLLAPALPQPQPERLFSRVVRDLARPDWLLPSRRLRFNSRVSKRSRNRFQIKRTDHVFLSAKDFPWLSDPQHSSFRELILI